ncbi:MAG: hypothetical protein HY735_19250 [Verrucomicrobia bacterium]|nr:hypothetical protein [Verrucomicrobiota bacterium]
MNRQEKLAELRHLQTKADAIRQELGIHPPGRVTFQSYRNAVEDEIVVVEADGFGGATTSLVQGNYPVDFFVRFEKEFATEQEAEYAADQLLFAGVAPSRVLGEPV